jgi:hypothetical protein
MDICNRFTNHDSSEMDCRDMLDVLCSFPAMAVDDCHTAQFQQAHAANYAGGVCAELSGNLDFQVREGTRGRNPLTSGLALMAPLNLSRPDSERLNFTENKIQDQGSPGRPMGLRKRAFFTRLQQILCKHSGMGGQNIPTPIKMDDKAATAVFYRPLLESHVVMSWTIR